MQEFIIMPSVGAVIGALTNEIAIRMLFRPYEEKRFLGKRIPFTPGLIPSQRTVIAGNIAEVFEKHLLSNDEIHNMLTSKKIHSELEGQLQRQIYSFAGPEGHLSLPENLDKIASQLQILLCDFTPQWLQKITSEKGRPMAESMIDEAFKSLGPLAAFAGGFKGKIADRIVEGIDKFAEESTKQQISEALLQYIKEEKLANLLTPHCRTVADILLEAIEQSLKKAVHDGSIDIRKKIEDKINSLPVSQLEEIILGFSRQQFRYISLFGGVIGALIGLIQALILQL